MDSDGIVPNSPFDDSMEDPEARLEAELRRVRQPDTPGFGGGSLPHQRFTSSAPPASASAPPAPAAALGATLADLAGASLAGIACDDTHLRR